MHLTLAVLAKTVKLPTQFEIIFIKESRAKQSKAELNITNWIKL